MNTITSLIGAVVTALAAVFPLMAVAAPAAAPASPPSLTTSLLSWTPEQQAYGYAHIESVLPVAVVRRGARVLPLPAAPAQIAPMIPLKAGAMSLEAFMQSRRISGLIAVKDGRVVLERYGLGRTAKDRWTSFSVAKSVTSTLIGAAVADGFIDSLDDPVSRYIPEMKGSAYDAVSIRQLITMTSGVKWNEDYGDLNSDVARVGFTPTVGGVNPVVAYMRRLPRAAPPGEKFHYDTGETDLAGVLVSNATHTTLANYFSRKIWAPFGMEADAFWLEDSAGHERGGCCLSMTLRDYARIGQFMLGGGIAGGRSVLPPGWIADATRTHVAQPEPYGYFWWIHDGGYAAEGIFGQTIAVFPADHLVVAVNAAWSKPDDDASWAEQFAMIEAIRRAATATGTSGSPPRGSPHDD